MKLNKTDVLILTAISNRYGSPTVSELYTDLPGGLFSNKRALSARLCEMRGRNLLNSKTTDRGINEWALSEAGGLVIKGQGLIPDTDISPDISYTPEPAISDAIQPDRMDIAPDISEREPDPIAADFAAAIEVADAITDGQYIYVHPEVSDDLVTEANTLRMAEPFPRLHDALYILAVLADFVGNRAEIATELDRIADYLREVSA